jgi:glycopeptide antibiotics resistance protein
VTTTSTARQPDAERWLVGILFVVYLVLLVGVVVLKFPFHTDESSGARTLNLIPYAGSSTSTGTIRWSEIVDNILVFVPFGVYLSELRPNTRFLWRFLPIVAASIVFEAIQFAANIGRADITDVIDNSLGGLVGLALYALGVRAFRRRTGLVVAILGVVGTIIALLVWLRLSLHILR